MGIEGVRIAIVSSQAFSLFNFRGPLIRELVQSGLEVCALAPDYDETSRNIVRSLGARPIAFDLSRTGINIFKDIISTVALAKKLRAIEPDFTLSYFIKPVIFGTFAAKIAGVPRRFALVPGLGYLFSIDETTAGMRRKLMRSIGARMYSLAFANCERVIFQNQEDSSWFVQRGLMPKEKVILTRGTGVDLAEWKQVPLPEGPPVFILVARLLQEKGIREFVTAAKMIRSRHPRVRCILVGGLDPNPSGLTHKEVESWVAAGSIEWTGSVANVKEWIAKASVFVLPSYYREGVPRSTQEAMAMGRPIITTDWVGCRETVEDGVNGFLVPVMNASAVESAMERFVSDSELIKSMGDQSRRIAEERFSVYESNRIILKALGLGQA